MYSSLRSGARNWTSPILSRSSMSSPLSSRGPSSMQPPVLRSIAPKPRFAFAVNCDGAGRLAAAAARLRVPFIHISTDYVFDGSKEGPYREDDIPLPINAYGRSKLEGETAVLDAYSAALVLRTSWLFSRWGHNFLKMMLSLAENGHVIRV